MSPNWYCAGSSCSAGRRSTGSTSTVRTLSFPDARSQYLAPIPRRARRSAGRLLRQAHRRRHTRTAGGGRAWSVWEGKISYLYPNPDIIARSAGDEFSLARSRIECHYFVHGAFFDHDGQLLTHVRRIRHIPT